MTAPKLTPQKTADGDPVGYASLVAGTGLVAIDDDGFAQPIVAGTRFRVHQTRDGVLTGWSDEYDQFVPLTDEDLTDWEQDA